MRKKRDHNKHLILAALPGTRKEIEIRTNLSKTCVQGWITRLHEAGEIRISKWVKPTPAGKAAAFYSQGAGKDARNRSKPLTSTQRDRRWRRKLKKQDPEAYEKLLKKSLARIHEFKAKTRRHGLMAAFYGQHKEK